MMPWSVRKSKGAGWDIVKSDTGKKVGHSPSKTRAEASVKARYANYKPGMNKRGGRSG